MRITYLAQRVPFPPDRGDKIITYNTIRHLADRHSISVFCLADGEEDLENVAGLRELVETVVAVPLRGHHAKLRGLRSLLAGGSLTASYFQEPELKRRLQDHLRTHGTDLILVFSSGMASLVQNPWNIPRIIHFCDLDSQKWSQFARSTAFPLSALYAVEGRRLLQFEKEIATSFCHSILCTPGELVDFQRLIGPARVSCIPAGVDLDIFRPASEAKIPGSIIFTGVMDYRPNVDAVQWFCRDVLPSIRHQVPRASFTICGSRPIKEVKQLGHLPGVTVTGRVPEVVPYLRSAQVAVVPMRLGRGIQTKLLEAMASGLACVATTTGFEGAQVEAGCDLLIADRAEDFSQAVVQLLTREEDRERIGAKARVAMEQGYHWTTNLMALDQIIAEETGHGESANIARPMRS